AAGVAVLFGPFFDATTAVGGEGASPRPSALTAATSTRTVCPTSAAASVYVDFVAPAIAAQPVPSLAQRCQPYAYDVGSLSHAPFDAVSAVPSRAAPVTAGGEVFSGAAAAAVP